MKRVIGCWKYNQFFIYWVNELIWRLLIVESQSLRGTYSVVFPMLGRVVFGSRGQCCRPNENVDAKYEDGDRNQAQRRVEVNKILVFMPLKAGCCYVHDTRSMVRHLTQLDRYGWKRVGIYLFIYLRTNDCITEALSSNVFDKYGITHWMLEDREKFEWITIFGDRWSHIRLQ